MKARTVPDTTAAWLVRLAARERPRARLICVPYAGAGTAAYRPWTTALPPWIEVWAVRLPGRESRLVEPPLTDLRALVAALTVAVAEELPDRAALPYALYGHSMGALVCYELAQALLAGGLPAPVHLFVSGRRAPQIPDELPAIYHLPPQEFLAEVRRLNGIPEAILAEPGLIELILPALAADFAVVETFTYAAAPPLPLGISAFGGDLDPTTAVAQLAAWEEQTRGPFSMRMLPGDHFFIHSQRDALLPALASDLDRALR
jgi:medium-chain acyl-[acyl-carrier-protein] hydrolase